MVIFLKNKLTEVRRNIAEIILVILVLSLYVFFGSYHIEKFAAVDEPLWLFGRIESYWNGLKAHQLQATQVSDKPGITVAIISGIGLIRENPHQYDPINWHGKFYKSADDIEKFLFAMRLPLFLFTAIGILFFYLLLRKLLSKEAAVISYVFIALSPVLIGMSRIINPDSLLWVFAPLSILSYFVFLKNNRKKYLYSCGIFLGLALLTKYVANILFIFFLGMIFLEYIFNKEKYGDSQVAEYLKKSLVNYFFLVLISLATFLILCPACWIKPKILLSATIYSQAFNSIWPVFAFIIGLAAIDSFLLQGRMFPSILSFLEKKKRIILLFFLVIFSGAIILVLLNVYSHMKFFNIADILNSPKSSYKFELSAGTIQIFVSNFYSLIFTISPIAFLIIIFSSLRWLKKPSETSEEKRLAFYLIVFIIIYYLGSAAASVASTIRYQIMLYPLIFVIAGIFMSEYTRLFFKKEPFKNLFYFVLIFIGVFSIYKIMPLYSGYASWFLPKNYYVDFKDMGAGSYEAADFLNSLPDSKNITVWTDKTGVCYFFNGNCYTSFTPEDFEDVKIDYLVLSSGREIRTQKMATKMRKIGFDFEKFYAEDHHLPFKLEIDDRPGQFVKIVKFNE